MMKRGGGVLCRREAVDFAEVAVLLSSVQHRVPPAENHGGMGQPRPWRCMGQPPKRNGPTLGGAIKRGAALCQFLVFGGQSDAVKLLEEIISVFSPQNGSSTETGVWTRRESNPHLHFDREPCYPLHHGP